MKTPRLFVAGSPGSYNNFFNNEFVPKIEMADLVMFTGGTDINPAMYGRNPHPSTQLPDMKRDAEEKEIFSVAHDMKIPMIGICRGAQFLCAMAGGILVQHQRHERSHWIHTDDGLQIYVTSDHHQRAFPFGMRAEDFKLIAWAEKLSPFNYGEDGEDMTGHKEAEIVYYPKIKALGIQDHPELQFPAVCDDDLASIRYHRTLIDKLLKGIL